MFESLFYWVGFFAIVPYTVGQLVLFALDLYRNKQKTAAAAAAAATNSVTANLRRKYSRGPRKNCHTASLDDALKARKQSQSLRTYENECTWALVTGASSGVGKALSEQLAQGGFSVVMVAIDEPLLDTAVQDLKKKYPGQEFRRVGANLSQGKYSGQDYLDIIKGATSDIDVQCVFNNAGYIVQGAHGRHVDGQVCANHEVNVTAAVRITNHFLAELLAKALPGCFGYTSSAQALVCLPNATQYSAGKAYVTTFAGCLHAEAAAHGIDVTSIQSGPILSNFKQNIPEALHGIFKFYDAISDTPDTVADTLLAAIGVVAWRDSSLYSGVNRIIYKVVETNFLAPLIGLVLPFTAEFKNKGQG